MAEEIVLEQDIKPQQPKHEGVTPRGNTVADMLSDRNGNLPSQEKLQEFQNRLMGRSKDFSKLSNEEKEKIMFQEMINWHFDQMPSIESMKKEIEEHPLTFEVKSLNENDVVGYKNQHVNLKSENVKLTVVSDGKTIKFNNRELMEQYRQALNNKDKKQNETPDVQKRGAQTHSSRVFED